MTTPPPEIVEAILAHGAEIGASRSGSVNGVFTTNDDANRLLVEDPFAFLLGVVVDYQMPAERAWRLPYELRARLDGWGPRWLAANPEAVHTAFLTPPKLHRFPNQTPRFVVGAAEIVRDRYEGDASRVWTDDRDAATIRRAFEQFPGISQKKAAMAVEILERDLGVEIEALQGSDVAYDIHLRRVMLRTGLATEDDRDHMVARARDLHPSRPGALDYPMWDIGRRWCSRRDPSCDDCVLAPCCPRHVPAGDAVTGA